MVKREEYIAVPPVIRSSSGHQKIAFVRGREIRLPWVAQGIPKPIITWDFQWNNGTPVPWGTTKTDSLLYISKASVKVLLNSGTNIEGVYISLARNVVGNDSIEYDLCELML